MMRTVAEFGGQGGLILEGRINKIDANRGWACGANRAFLGRRPRFFVVHFSLFTFLS
jgi:hypothetical protein